jgi:excinuclease UvrABC ATPase subunit
MDNQISINDLINRVDKLSLGEFEEFFLKIQSLRVQKNGITNTDTEHKLLKQIRTNLTTPKQMRFEYLIARRDTHTITENELSELIKLTHDIEKNDITRFKRIAKLAELKQMTIPDVVKHYQLSPIQHG